VSEWRRATGHFHQGGKALADAYEAIDDYRKSVHMLASRELESTQKSNTADEKASVARWVRVL
jgi:COP9 signalosome complex subunit 4